MNIAKKLNNMVISPRLENSGLQVVLKRRKPVKMRIKGNRYYGYTTVTDPLTGKKHQIEFSLDAYVGDRDTALENLGEKLGGIRKGELPNLSNSKFKLIAENWKKNPVCAKGIPHGSIDNFRLLDRTVSIYFGNFKINKITQEEVRKYLEHRKSKGIMEGTLRKETRVLKWVMLSVSPSWVLPGWKAEKEKRKKVSDPTAAEVAQMIQAIKDCSSRYGVQYQDIASVMAYTGLDTSDALRLNRESLVGRCIEGERGKTGKPFRVGITSGLEAILARLTKIVTLDPSIPFFDVPSADAVSQAIKRAFVIIGCEQYHAKSLRDYYAGQLFDQKESDNFIQDSLGQERGSKQTQRYTFAKEQRLVEVAAKMPDLGLLGSAKKEGAA